ncbi:MAG TPA: DinB family protein [Vicinamibacterales bacterium]|jgi:uncharacterized damage-inducible protein DinB|nr:DinB family protein [Vicinamibacterales bacterium]
MATNATEQLTVSAILIDRWDRIGQKLAGLAAEIPESKFDYRPADGVRTIGDVLRHVAFWNRYVADSARGKAADDRTNELPADRFSTKAQILEALSQSAADAGEALKETRAGLSPDQTAMVTSFIEHTCEHYGQIVVYARMNGIVPPASRG